GTLDPSWNPGPALGIDLVGTNDLNAVPVGVFPGPTNSILTLLQFKSLNGIKNLRMAVIDADGGVSGSFAVPPVANSSVALVQPDGRILVAGPFTNWGGNEVAGMVRVARDGSIDSGFNVQLTGSNSFVRMDGLSLDSLGRLVLAGSFNSVNG